MAGGENIWEMKTEDGEEYQLHRSEITVGVLRQFKGWFGAPYGKFLVFVQLLMEGDADAWCCALWLVQKNAGVKPLKPPNVMDFAVGDLMLSGNNEDEDEADVDEDPTTQPSEESPPEAAEPESPTPD